MTRYIVIEDERLAFEEIKRLMTRLRPEYELVGWAQTIEQASMLVAKKDYELIITDIRLADGLCFDVFERQPSHCPVIFTTAYDEYALKAFKLNSVDYLLKPIEENELEEALDKFERNLLVGMQSANYEQFANDYMSHTRKNRFLIRMGDTFRYVQTADVAFFYSEDKTTYLYTLEGKSYIVDYSLDSIEPLLNPDDFFRIARCCIANIKTVRRVSRYFGGRLSVQFSPECPVGVTISRSRSLVFLKWMGGEQ